MKRWGIPMPDKSWLAIEYLLPPDGKGRACHDIASELGVSKDVVQRWIRELGINQDAHLRQRFACMKDNPMLALDPPDENELARLYYLPPNGEGLSLDGLAEHFRVSRPTVQRWLDLVGIHEPFLERHSKRMSGEGNPAYTNGNSQRYVGRQLVAAKEKVCDWCGTSEKVEIHHMDHDRTNNDLDNLTWLCGHCNKLEAHLWHLVQNQRATYQVIQDETAIKLTITFARR